MKKLHILPLLFVLAFIGCRKEEIIEDKEIIIDPVEIESMFLRGTIQNNQGPVPNALVEIYQEEVLKGTTQSDQAGTYSTEDIVLREDKPVTVFIKKEGYYNYASRYTKSSTSADIWLATATNQFISNGEMSNPGSDSLITISGKVTAPNGIPIEGVFVAIWEEEMLIGNNSYDIDGSVLETNPNGEFSMLVPKDVELKMIVAQTEGCSSQSFLLSRQDALALNGLLPVELIGPYNTDTILPTFENGQDQSNVNIITIDLALNAEGCNNAPLVSGTLQGTINIGGEVKSLSRSVRNGVIINPTLEYCLSSTDPTTPITIEAVVATAFAQSDSIKITTNSLSIDLGTTVTCEPSNPDIPEISFSIDGQRYNVQNNGLPDSIYTEIRGDSLLITAPSPNNGFFELTIVDYQEAVSEYTNFKYKSPNLEFEQGGLTITRQIGGLVGNRYESIFQGEILNKTTGEVERMIGVIQLDL